MADSRRLAALIGPALMAIAVSETIKLHIWAMHIAPVIYRNGCLILVGGPAIVPTHNYWTWRWPVLITIIG